MKTFGQTALEVLSEKPISAEETREFCTMSLLLISMLLDRLGTDKRRKSREVVKTVEAILEGSMPLVHATEDELDPTCQQQDVSSEQMIVRVGLLGHGLYDVSLP